jgi:hypothetical protein
MSSASSEVCCCSSLRHFLLFFLVDVLLVLIYIPTRCILHLADNHDAAAQGLRHDGHTAGGGLAYSVVDGVKDVLPLVEGQLCW